MKYLLFPRLAVSGIRKNRRLYIPYLLTGVGTVMMFYIMSFLASHPLVVEMRGGNTLREILRLGQWVIGIFSLIFLFYTNSFLIRRRGRELGLYNVLGMGKGKLARILFWEGMIVLVICLTVGMALGIALSKFAELALMKILDRPVTDELYFVPDAAILTGTVFGVIFLLLVVSNVIRVLSSNPLALLHSEALGEKPPKANWLLALLGTGLLGLAYYIAVSIQDPVEALAWFFIAVIMVVVATYLLFIAGSVTLCRSLQRRKRYYYRKQHFVSISSIVYRMKRNGAGLASVCILSTMVLVMITSTFSLYVGKEDGLRASYPRDLAMTIYFETPEDATVENRDRFRNMAIQAIEAKNVTPESLVEYRRIALYGHLDPKNARITRLGEGSGSSTAELFLVPLEDYNLLYHTDIVLAEDEALVKCINTSFSGSELEIEGLGRLKLKGTVDEFFHATSAVANLYPTIFLFLNDPVDFIAPLEGDEDIPHRASFYLGFDTDAPDSVQISLRRLLDDGIDRLHEEQYCTSGYTDSIASNRDDFYNLYGGLFFIGILLSLLFCAAAVLILYYKQICEGYEDQSRFEIMQKVGMTKRDIRKSINSQMLTVFFAPLLFAGMHLSFAFPMIWKMLKLFNLSNLRLVIGVNLGAFALFALCYAAVYRLTSNAYYAIVCGKPEN